MQPSAVINSFRFIALLSAFALIGFGGFTTVNAAEVESATDVRANVCDGATLTIESPEADSVLDSTQVTFAGTIDEVSQIDLYVDEAYSGTRALPANQAQYSEQFTIPVGTHTIRIVGVSLCGTGDPSAEVIITIEVEAEPGPGSETPTVVDPDTPAPSENGGGGGVIVTRPDPGGEQINGGDSALIDRFVVKPFETLLRVMDIDSTFEASKGFGGLFRIVAVIAGLLLLIAASGIIGILNHWRKNEVSWKLLLVFQLLGLLVILLALLA